MADDARALGANLGSRLEDCEHREYDSTKLTRDRIVLCNKSSPCVCNGDSTVWKGELRKTCAYYEDGRM